MVDIRQRVDTIVVVMLENRSFDHMLGYLSLSSREKPRTDIEGLTSLSRSAYANDSKGVAYRPRLVVDHPFDTDLPHGRDLVAVQLRWPASGNINMRGFVEAYRRYLNTNSAPAKPPSMELLDAPPMMDFFAEQYLVCDHWFAPLPADTQPNRLMSLSGFSTIDVTVAQTLDQPVVYEWLTAHNVRWRVYRSGLPFDMLLPRLWDDIFSERFRSIKYLATDVKEEPDATFPQVIFVEPSFGDAPVHLGYPANDDHPPIASGPGQHFLRDIYLALTSSPERWRKTVLVVTYDEHGGFFDHVVPPGIRTDPPVPGLYQPFETTGVRVPALVVSPLVRARSVHKGVLDHTSILQLVASRFGDDGESYSADVERRRTAGIGSVADTLNREEPRLRAPMPPESAVAVEVRLLSTKPAKDKNTNERAFEAAAVRLLTERRADVKQAYPELMQWEAGRR